VQCCTEQDACGCALLFPRGPCKGSAR
jgi:hypothetical protein